MSSAESLFTKLNALTPFSVPLLPKPHYLIALNDNDKVTFTNRLAEFLGLAAMDDLPHISPETIRRGAKIVEEAGTGWSYNAIREQFAEQLVEGFKPDNVNAAFIGFVKKKVAKRP